MKKCLSLLLVLALLFGVGGVGAFAQEPSFEWDELDPVVLDEPIVFAQDEIVMLAWTVEEDGYFLFSWNAGDFDIWVSHAASGEGVFALAVYRTNSTHIRHLSAGEYIVRIAPWGAFHAVHSVTITETDPPPPPPEPGVVVLGEPLLAASNVNSQFNWVVEEDGYFRFSWISGAFDLHVVRTDSSGFFSRWEVMVPGHARTMFLQAGEYRLTIFPFYADLSDQSMVITATEPPPPGVVVLGEPLETEPNRTAEFTWVVEEDGYFLFSWVSGNFDVRVQGDDGVLTWLGMRPGESRMLHLQAGEYLLTLFPNNTNMGFHSMVITETEPPPPPPPPPSFFTRAWRFVQDMFWMFRPLLPILLAIFVMPAWLRSDMPLSVMLLGVVAFIVLL
ncbi:MAG: hypothetical protein FWD06_03405 [Oscillospiraceae bacterium]|nr:hypothetical protein [Oscillospiraceae bacterium]